jgi:type II secretion system protein I
MRPGVTLLEVVISLAIFLFSIVAIAHLVSLSTDRAVQAQYRQQAAFLCQSKLAEIAAGAEPLSSQGGVPLAEDSSWQWSSSCTESEVPGLWQVTVTVSRPVRGDQPLEVSLSQFVLDPAMRGSTTDPAPSVEVEEETGKSSSSSTSSTSGSSPSGGAAPPSPAPPSGGKSGNGGGGGGNFGKKGGKQ